MSDYEIMKSLIEEVVVPWKGATAGVDEANRWDPRVTCIELL